MGRRRGHMTPAANFNNSNKFNLFSRLLSHAYQRSTPHPEHSSSPTITLSSSHTAMSSTTPLRERPQATDSWQPTTPLRISKRADSPVAQPPPPAARPPLDRRSSGSYAALKDRKVVTKSPFLVKLSSAIPGPAKSSSNTSPRKVSGEKRQRTLSMHHQAENEHPLGFKRRQSRGFQGLLQAEPVSKSPFKKPSPAQNINPAHPVPAMSSPASSLPTPNPTDEEDDADDDDLPPPPPPKELFGNANGRYSPSPHRASPSPARSSLVSKRLHGPRTPSRNSRSSDSDRDAKSERRKTVTFDETCDVVEYDVEDEDSGILADGAEPFSWVRDNEEEEEEDSFELRASFNMQMNRNLSAEDINMFDDEHDTLRVLDEDEHDVPTQDNDHDHEEHHDELDDDDGEYDHDDPDNHARGRALTVRNRPSLDLSIEALHIGADDSITGLVNSMLQDARPHTPPPAQDATSTNRTPVPLPAGVETEDGVPLGRTRHAERAREAHSAHHAQFHDDGHADADEDEDDDSDGPMLPLSIATAAISSVPSTPPRRGAVDDATAVLSPGSQIPLGRSTHSERRQARRKVERENEKEVDEDVSMLPPSPSPAKAKREARERERESYDGLIPKFELTSAPGKSFGVLFGATPSSLVLLYILAIIRIFTY